MEEEEEEEVEGTWFRRLVMGKRNGWMCIMCVHGVPTLTAMLVWWIGVFLWSGGLTFGMCEHKVLVTALLLRHDGLSHTVRRQKTTTEWRQILRAVLLATFIVAHAVTRLRQWTVSSLHGTLRSNTLSVWVLECASRVGCTCDICWARRVVSLLISCSRFVLRFVRRRRRRRARHRKFSRSAAI